MSSWLFGDTPTLPISSNQTTDSTSPPTAIGASLPPIPKKLTEQIKSGDYVDLAELPPARARPSQWHTNRMSTLELLQLQEVDRQQKLIPDFITWSQCFAVYTAVLAADQPQRIPELMGYQYEMARYARKYKWPSWVIFDMHFRQEAACRPTLSWADAAGHRESKLYSQCFTGMAKDPRESWCRTCQSLDHSTSLCPMMPPTKVPRRERQTQETSTKASEICRNFNTKGCNYPKCQHQHVCLHCKEKHPAFKCPRPETNLGR